MKKFSVFLAALVLSVSASATVFGNTDNSVRPVANANAEADAQALALSAANAAAVAKQQQEQRQQQQQAAIALSRGGDAAAEGGRGGDGGKGGDSGGNVLRGGDVTVKGAERSAPGVSVSAPVQVRNCRLGIGGGGSNTSGSMSAAIIIGNDQTCLSGAATEGMEITNARFPGTFGRDDYLSVQCKVEGMAETKACKEFAERTRATAALEGQTARTSSVAYYGN